jgi:hypothetical protein
VSSKKAPAGNQLSDTKKSSAVASGAASNDQKKEASIKKEAVKEQKAPASKEDSNKASIAGKVQQAA